MNKMKKIYLIPETNIVFLHTIMPILGSSPIPVNDSDPAVDAGDAAAPELLGMIGLIFD